MSMWDKSYCSTVCDQKDCERNLRFNKPDTKYYSVAEFDRGEPSHEKCIWKVKRK